jgi:hypothetical protein
MHRLLLAGTALTIISIGSVAAQSPAPAPTPRPAAQQTAVERTATIRENEFTANNLVGMRVYALKAGEAAQTAPRTTGSTVPAPGAAPAPANRNEAATATAPRTEPPAAMPGGRPAVVTDEQWRTMNDRYQNIGEVNDLVLTGDGRIQQVVLGVGGFLGIGEKNVAIAWSDLRLMRGSDGKLFAIVTRTKEQLNAMPTFKVERD